MIFLTIYISLIILNQILFNFNFTFLIKKQIFISLKYNLTQTSLRQQPTILSKIGNNEASSKLKKVKFVETDPKDTLNTDTPNEINNMLIDLNNLSEEILNFE